MVGDYTGMPVFSPLAQKEMRSISDGSNAGKVFFMGNTGFLNSDILDLVHKYSSRSSLIQHLNSIQSSFYEKKLDHFSQDVYLKLTKKGDNLLYSAASAWDVIGSKNPGVQSKAKEFMKDIFHAFAPDIKIEGSGEELNNPRL